MKSKVLSLLYLIARDILYAVVLPGMLRGATGRKGKRKVKVTRTSYLLVLSGAIPFVVSDSLLAINKFSFHFESAGLAAMSTYIYQCTIPYSYRIY